MFSKIHIQIRHVILLHFVFTLRLVRKYLRKCNVSITVCDDEIEANCTHA